jgi:hypothetical protein
MLDLVWRNWKGLPVSVGVVSFLEKSAIDKDLQPASFQKIA